ncbi:hypothetical protein CC78DRAFT_576790 [Lojkania enalia]|uniref:Fructose-bisphosphate aldolase n=1 Tax=Lojkania enalia TaxID=147567 RepID=A0A9P4KHF3_9PLEO|nr:hypothetical protein CC78DRAFT_576790 [Didymosphaeria enalia]
MAKDLNRNKALKIVEAATKGGEEIIGYRVDIPWVVEIANDTLVHAALEVVDNASVLVVVHMDHALPPEITQWAADLGGFDGIMVNMSHCDNEEIFQNTRELANYCNERGIITEAEPGRIEGEENGVRDTSGLDLEEGLTTLE